MRRVIVVAIGLIGCEAPAPVTPIVSVLKRTPQCAALMTEDTPVRPELEIANLCDVPTVPTMFAAVDVIELVIDYGPDVEFAASTIAPSPDITLAIDGTTSDLAIELSPEQRLGGRAFFVATFRAPPDPSTDVRIGAGVATGFWTEVATVFSIVPPPITFELAECVMPTCGLVAAVGSVHARISIPGDASLPVAIHQAIDQIVQPDPVLVTTSTPSGGDSIANIAIPVPAARPGALWTLTAQVGVGQSAPTSVTLNAPVIGTTLTCGLACTVAPGESVGLTITAPAGISPSRAYVTTRIDGIPQLVSAPVDLVASDTMAVGLLTLVAPQTSGAWQIDVTVAGYAAPSIAASVQ